MYRLVHMWFVALNVPNSFAGNFFLCLFSEFKDAWIILTSHKQGSDYRIEVFNEWPYLDSVHWRIYIVKFWMHPSGPNSLNFIQILGNFAKLYIGVPLKGWCPHLEKILDPPLVLVWIFVENMKHDNLTFQLIIVAS